MTTRILIPPGIGDIYWVMVKLRAFLAANNLTDPELTVVSDPDPLDAHLRGIEFLKMYPWITVGNPQSMPNDRSLQAIWDEAYAGSPVKYPDVGCRSIFPDVMGYDFLMAYNGKINTGVNLEDADSYGCDWTLPAVPCIDCPGKYMLCFFSFLGTYQSHERDFPVEQIAAAINHQYFLTGYTPIFLGGKTEAAYDSKQKDLISRVPYAMDLVGRTALTKVMGLLQSASLIFGYHSGIPNLGAAIGAPTVLLWDDRYPDNTSMAVVPPRVRGKTYIALATKNLSQSLVEGAIAAVKLNAYS